MAQKISNPETCTYGQRALEMTQIFMIVITFDVPWKILQLSLGYDGGYRISLSSPNQNLMEKTLLINRIIIPNLI